MEITSREVYARLLKEVEAAEFAALFGELRRTIAELEGYLEPADVFAALGPDNPNHAEKDSCLYGLISASRRRDQPGSTALTLLLIAIWPSLVSITQRLGHLLKEASDPLAEVYWAFLQELDRPTYDRRWKIAANLSRNTAKRTIGSLRSTWRYRKTLQGIQEWAARSAEDTSEILSRILGSPSDLSEEDKPILAEAAQDLANAQILTAEEALLLVGHAIYGRSLKDIAAEHGVGHDAVRQRYCRLKAKLRNHFGLP